MQASIKRIISNHIDLCQQVFEEVENLQKIEKVTSACIQVYQTGHKILFCGNGGSAADAQHIAAELSGKFYLDRSALDAEALHVNTSYLTAVANDYSFEDVYARLVQAKGKPGDLLFGISTSGKSINILRALQKAKELKMHTVGLTGVTGGPMKDWCDTLIQVPSKDVPRIQECHILIGHIICELIEKELFS